MIDAATRTSGETEYCQQNTLHQMRHFFIFWDITKMCLTFCVARVNLAKQNDPFGHNWPINRRLSMAGYKAGSIPKLFNSIRFRFLPHQVQFGSVSNYDIEFINFRFFSDAKLIRGKKILQLCDMIQFLHVHFTENGYF